MNTTIQHPLTLPPFQRLWLDACTDPLPTLPSCPCLCTISSNCKGDSSFPNQRMHTIMIVSGTWWSHKGFILVDLYKFGKEYKRVGILPEGLMYCFFLSYGLLRCFCCFVGLTPLLLGAGSNTTSPHKFGSTCTTKMWVQRQCLSERWLTKWSLASNTFHDFGRFFKIKRQMLPHHVPGCCAELLHAGQWAYQINNIKLRVPNLSSYKTQHKSKLDKQFEKSEKRQDTFKNSWDLDWQMGLLVRSLWL